MYAGIQVYLAKSNTTNSGEAIEVLGTKELLYEHSESTTGLQTHGEWT